MSEAHAYLHPAQLGVIVNDDDPLSREIANYYQKQRHIPFEHLIHTRFKPGIPVLSHREFDRIKAQVDKQLPEEIQALVLTWTYPYRVDCMSITTAFTAGFDPTFCADGCHLTRISPYYNSDSWVPYRHYHWRPTMMLAGDNLQQVKNLIDRGMAADHSAPAGTGYLVTTSDPDRNVRSITFNALIQAQMGKLQLEHVQADYIENKSDVLFYFTGKTHVARLMSNVFRPGAIADHLTSTGGVLDGFMQMSSLRWLEAGATASYGTVAEPCNFPGKFPNPAVVIPRYRQGETLLEAYWKSVEMPGQGLFIGEPLARPYAIPELE